MLPILFSDPKSVSEYISKGTLSKNVKMYEVGTPPLPQFGIINKMFPVKGF